MLKNKLALSAVITFALLLGITGCDLKPKDPTRAIASTVATRAPTETAETSTEAIIVSTVTPRGETMRFKRKKLTLDITNVKHVKTETIIDDMGDSYEESITSFIQVRKSL